MKGLPEIIEDNRDRTPKPRKQTAKWTCKDGRKIRICDMEDAHLINTLRMLARNYSVQCLRDSLAADLYAVDAPDGAAAAAEQAADELAGNAETLAGIENQSPLWTPLLKEYVRRFNAAPELEPITDIAIQLACLLLRSETKE